MRFFFSLLFILLVKSSFASVIGEDGLHKPDWLQFTFKDLAEDLEEAHSNDKRLFIIFEQRGCIYCKKMHEEVFSDPKIAKLITEKFYVIQMNLFGDEEVTDFDSETLTEKEMAIKWGVHFTPTIMFFPVESDVYKPANLAAVMTMPGAFSKYTTFNLLNFILEEGYNGSEHFQKYHSRKYLEQKNSK